MTEIRILLAFLLMTILIFVINFLFLDWLAKEMEKRKIFVEDEISNGVE